jgi:hypothetical protein
MTFKYCLHILLLDLVEGKLQEIKGVKPVHLSLSQFWDPPLKKMGIKYEPMIGERESSEERWNQ